MALRTRRARLRRVVGRKGPRRPKEATNPVVAVVAAAETQVTVTVTRIGYSRTNGADHHESDIALVRQGRAPMEFRYPFLVAMQSQNIKMYRALKKAGELERFVALKANDAHRLYLELTRDAPKGPDAQPTMQAAREAEEYVRAMMFEFPDDSERGEQDKM
jgi:hypothetical protein